MQARHVVFPALLASLLAHWVLIDMSGDMALSLSSAKPSLSATLAASGMAEQQPKAKAGAAGAPSGRLPDEPSGQAGEGRPEEKAGQRSALAGEDVALAEETKAAPAQLPGLRPFSQAELLVAYRLALAQTAAPSLPSSTGRMRIRLVIDASGRLEGFTVLDSGGDADFAGAIREWLVRAAGTAQMPEGLKGRQFEVEVELRAE